MSTFRRVVSGSIASWCGIIVSLISQIALVPIYLAFWDTQTYGIWLALLSAFSLIQTLDRGHTRFLWNEFLRITSRRRALVRRTFWSGMVAGVILGGLQAACVFGIVAAGALNWLLLGNDVIQQDLGDQCSTVLAAFVLVWWLFGTIGGIVVVVVLPFGHYTKTAWWGIGLSLVTAVFPTIVVVYGGNLQAVGLTHVLCVALFNIPVFIHMVYLLRVEKLYPVRPSWRIMFRNVVRSQVITVQSLFEMLRQQGTRLVLAPLAGSTAVAGFSTMRTGSNVALQGLHSITGPVLPELMHFVGVRDQAKMESCFATLWIVVAFVMIPGALFAQLIARPLFELWTAHKIEFDPVVFSMLTSGVLVYSLAQPAMVLVNGNNLLRPQLCISILAGSLCVLLLILTVPTLMIRGAALALLIAECVALLGFTRTATNWLSSKGLAWPSKSFNRLFTATALASVAIMLMGFFESFQWLTFIVSLPLCLVLGISYWRLLPSIARSKVLNLVNDLGLRLQSRRTPVGR